MNSHSKIYSWFSVHITNMPIVLNTFIRFKSLHGKSLYDVVVTTHPHKTASYKGEIWGFRTF